VRDWLRRRLGIVVVVAALLLFASANRVATLVTDLWWFDALGYRSVFTTILGTRVLMGVVFGLALAAIIAVNLLVVRRIRPLFVPSTPQQAAVERYRQMADPYLPWLILAVAAVFGITSGAAVSAEWDTYLLWQHAQPFGVDDPQFGRDIGYYVFQLPFLKFVQTWLFTSLLLATMLTVGGHYLLGGIRPENAGEKVMPNVKVHLSVLLALLLAARGWGYWLDRFLLNYSPRGQVTGASYTDVNAELPALNLLLVVTVVAIGLVIYNVRRRGFLLPGAAIGLLVLASILLQGAYPAAIQRLRVDPQELTREAEYIERNLEATLTAYDLHDADLQPFSVQNDLDRDQVQENEVTIRNVRLWDPQVLETTYAELQALRPYYRFADVDVDRYEIDGQLRQVMLSARELQTGGLPPEAQTWQNIALTFTHGFGIVASQVNVADEEGQPVFLARDIPTRGAEELVPDERQGIYFGEAIETPYSIVGTEQAELDYEESGTSAQVTTSYDGDGGVELGGILGRLAFATRFTDPNIVLSGLLRDESRVLWVRDVSERVHAVAPYLDLDDDPYPVVLRDRVKWVVDAYTVSAFYPYSERRPLNTGTSRQSVNYVRNSVKAVVDAYDGTVDLYVIDEGDPVINAWREAFDGPYKSASEMPEGLEQQFRYPQDMFRLQAQLYQTYHIPGAPAFYSKADAWDIPRDAAALSNNPSLSTADVPMEPYYLLMRLPGETDEEFVLIQPYLARNKPNMIAWLAGRSDPGHYGQLFAVQFPSDQTILGPQQAQARIEQNDIIAEYITLRDQAGSDVIRGNLLVIPVENSILYVQPLFLESPQAQIPQLERVVLVMGDRTVMDSTLSAALARLIGAEDLGELEEEEEREPVGEDGAVDGPDTGEADIAELVRQAIEAFRAADDALAAGDLGEYQRQIDRAQRLIEDAAALQNGEPDAGEDEPEPTESPTDG
jgi:uncharacterized protein